MINIKRYSALLLMLLCGYYSKAQKFDVDTIQYQGTTENMVNLVILSDGYTLPELDKFVKDANVFKNYFFNQHPFSRYKNYFNVFVIKVPSLESGAIHANDTDDCPKGVLHDSVHVSGNRLSTATPMPVSNPKNYFGSSFDNSGIHRLVVAKNQDAVRSVLNDNFPGYSQALILVNSPYYGGSGGLFPTATLNMASNDIAIHELGHSFASLADEYWSGLQFLGEQANSTQYGTADRVPWKKWIGTNGIGIYNYGGASAKAVWYRPHEFCKMQYLVAPFCDVCSEAIIEKIHSLTNPILRRYPENTGPLSADSLTTFRVKLATPDPNTLRVEWNLNGEPIALNINSVRINPGMLHIGQNNLTVTVMDTTAMIRNEAHDVHTYESQWTIVSKEKSPLNPPSVRWGDSIQTCYGSNAVLSVKDPQSGLRYKWYKRSSGGRALSEGTNFVTPRLTENTTYYLEGFFNKQRTVRVPVTVKVLNEIAFTEEIIIGNGGDAGADTVKVTILNPGQDVNYRWYASETDTRPIRTYSRSATQRMNISRDGTVLQVTVGARGAAYWVSAVSKTSTCSSKRRRVFIKGDSSISGR